MKIYAMFLLQCLEKAGIEKQDFDSFLSGHDFSNLR